MANVKLTWNDNSTNEVGYRVYRLSSTGPNAPTTGWTGVGEDSYWVNEGATPTGNNVDSSGVAANPLLTTAALGSGDLGLAGTAGTGQFEYVDTNVGAGTWYYRVEAFNDAGSAWCKDDPVVKVEVTS